LVDVSWKEDGQFSPLDTARNFPQMELRFLKQIREETRNIASFGADGVLSDSMLSTVIASRLARTNVITVLNQLRLESPTAMPGVAASIIAAGTLSIGASMWNLSSRVFIPDLPAPYTISEKNLWPSSRVDSRYIGFLIPPRDDSTDPVVESLRADRRTKVYWQISGPPKTRAPLLASALELGESCKGNFISVISGGNPSGEVEPRRMPFGWFYGWCPVKDSMIEVADIIISRAGHTSIAQFIWDERPSVLIPIPQQTEQEGNASKAHRLGVAVSLEQKALDRRTLLEAMERLMAEETSKRLREVSRIARAHDATSEILKAIA